MATDTPRTSGYDRRDLIRLGLLLLALLVIVGVVAARRERRARTRARRGQVTGVLTSVSDQELVLQPNTGGEAIVFTVRPEDVRQLDLRHLEQHAADSLPSIVHYEREGDERFAIRVDDAPV